MYYLSVHHGKETRQKELKEKFGFECACGLCSLPAEESKQSDARLEEISALDVLIGQGGMGGIVDEPLRFLGLVERLVGLYREQSPKTFDLGLPRAWLDAAQICIANGDLARGRVFVERAIEGWTLCLGGDCKQVVEHGGLATKPETLRLYGVSWKWKLGVDEVPRGLEEGEFEDWLWRREKASTVVVGSGVKADRDIFPSFDELPGRWKVEGHWCLLGSIVDTMGGLVRLKLTIEDISGKTFPLWFYTPERGEELTPALVKEGNAVAILYPHRHSFQFDEPGIRLEDPSIFKVRSRPPFLDNLIR